MGAPSRNNPKSIILWYSSTFQRLTNGPKPALPVKIAGAANAVNSDSNCKSMFLLCLRWLDGDKFVVLRHLSNIFGDFHRAVFRSAHAAEVGRFECVLGQRFVVIRAGRFRIERE